MKREVELPKHCHHWQRTISKRLDGVQMCNQYEGKQRTLSSILQHCEWLVVHTVHTRDCVLTPFTQTQSVSQICGTTLNQCTNNDEIATRWSIVRWQIGLPPPPTSLHPPLASTSPHLFQQQQNSSSRPIAAGVVPVHHWCGYWCRLWADSKRSLMSTALQRCLTTGVENLTLLCTAQGWWWG